MNRELNNPFLIAGYHSPKYFCDRQEEGTCIKQALENDRNITLIAPRRMGKTGLIKNIFYEMQQRGEIVTIYLDIFSTQNLNEFVRLLAESVIGSLDSDFEKILSKMGKLFKSFRPSIQFDELTGLPQITIEISQDKEETSLKEIFNYLASNNQRCVLAIDEFQQIAAYPEKGVEALLRSYTQFVHNTRFIFAGSKRHIMQEMFMSAKRPFFQSTQIISVGAIDKNAYYTFAQHFFNEKGFSFQQELFNEMYDDFDGYTWYMQALLNRLYGYNENIVEKQIVTRAIEELVEENASGYQNLLDAYSSSNVRLLKAIAKEGAVAQINSGEFISKYNLKAASSVKSSLDKLIDKELVYKSEKGYVIYDRFMSIWLQRLP
jgi:AAA+ ATPase superfamily predicted ATPase